MIADSMLWFFGFFTLQEIAFLYSKKCSARMRTAAYKGDVASDRRRHENVPRHIFLNMKKSVVPVRLFLTEGTPYGTLKTIIGVSIPWRKKTNLRLLEIDIEVTYFG